MVSEVLSIVLKKDPQLAVHSHFESKYYDQFLFRISEMRTSCRRTKRRTIANHVSWILFICASDRYTVIAANRRNEHEDCKENKETRNADVASPFTGRDLIVITAFPRCGIQMRLENHRVIDDLLQ